SPYSSLRLPAIRVPQSRFPTRRSSDLAIEWRRAHLIGEVTGEAVERLTGEPIGDPIGEVTGEPPVESGELVDDPTSEVVDVVIDPHELAVESALTTVR